MIFVIKNKKYDTDKMELISEKCECTYDSSLFGSPVIYNAHDVELYKSQKGAWILKYSSSYNIYGKLLSEKEAKSLLMNYDLKKYEEIFGELEEG